MTIETRSTIELADIIAIEFECRDCRAKVVRKIDGFKNVPGFCGNCEKQWLIDGSQAHDNLYRFLVRLQELSKASGEPFLLRFEVKGLTK